VLTKLDLMDRGTDAREVLEGRSLCLEHGRWREAWAFLISFVLKVATRLSRHARLIGSHL